MRDDPPTAPPGARDLLVLARTDRAGASRALAQMTLDQQVAAVCEAPLSQRATLLELTPEPEKVIPRMPPAELCFTAKAVGLADASWMMEHATGEQIVACGDLDAWRGLSPDLESLNGWLTILAEAGPDTLLRATQSMDAELLVLYLRDRVDVFLKPNDDESWEPPEGGQTLEGQFYLRARHPNDDLAALLRLAQVVFQADYWLYFRLLQGVIWELPTELEEWSLRWRTGRLDDLGFPSWDSAMRIYGYLRPEKREQLPDEPIALDTTAHWDLPVATLHLPANPSADHRVFQALGELDEDERRSFLYAFIALANKVAIADSLPLGNPDTLPAAIDKAARVVSEALDFVAERNGAAVADVLRRLSLEYLFRVGASLDPQHLPLNANDADSPAPDIAAE